MVNSKSAETKQLLKRIQELEEENEKLKFRLEEILRNLLDDSELKAKYNAGHCFKNSGKKK